MTASARMRPCVNGLNGSISRNGNNAMHVAERTISNHRNTRHRQSLNVFTSLESVRIRGKGQNGGLRVMVKTPNLCIPQRKGIRTQRVNDLVPPMVDAPLWRYLSLTQLHDHTRKSLIHGRFRHQQGSCRFQCVQGAHGLHYRTNSSRTDKKILFHRNLMMNSSRISCSAIIQPLNMSTNNSTRY